MKKIKSLIFSLALVAFASCQECPAQTPPNPATTPVEAPPAALGTSSQSALGLIGSGLLKLGETVISTSPTNFAVAPYGTYVVDKKKFGFGLAGVYNVNNYFGAVVAVDYVDQFLGVTGGIQLQLPTHPLAHFGLTNFMVMPFVISAVGTSLQGGGSGNGGVQTINTAGIDTHFGHLWGGQFLVGGAYGTRTGAGAYSGGYLNGFIGWKKGF